MAGKDSHRAHVIASQARRHSKSQAHDLCLRLLNSGILCNKEGNIVVLVAEFIFR